MFSFFRKKKEKEDKERLISLEKELKENKSKCLKNEEKFKYFRKKYRYEFMEFTLNHIDVLMNGGICYKNKLEKEFYKWSEERTNLWLRQTKIIKLINQYKKNK